MAQFAVMVLTPPQISRLPAAQRNQVQFLLKKKVSQPNPIVARSTLLRADQTRGCVRLMQRPTFARLEEKRDAGRQIDVRFTVPSRAGRLRAGYKPSGQQFWDFA